MTRSKFSGIKRKVLIVAVLPAATATILLTLFFSISQTRDLQQSLKDRGLVIVQQLSPASEYGVYSGNSEFLHPVVDALMQEADVRSVVIRDAGNDVLVKSGPDALATSALDAKSAKSLALQSDDGNSWVFQTPIFQTELSVIDPFYTEQFGNRDYQAQLKKTDQILGWVSVELSNGRTLENQARLRINTGLIALLVLLLSAVLAQRLGRNITEPILLLNNAVDEIKGGKFDIEVSTGGKDELQSLQSGINTMAVALKNSRANLEDQVNQATQEMRNAIGIVEKRNQELEAARKEAESSNKAKSSFLANISHEIRTPLNGIQGFHMLLAKTALDNTQQDYVSKIEKSTNTLLSLLNDLLDLSQLEVAQLSIKESVFNIRELLDESIYLGLPEAQKKGLEIIVIIEPEVPRRFVGAANRIAQVVKNLVSNAVKFTSLGEVVVRAKYIDSTTVKKTLEISVSDTGIGIVESDLERLFLPFAQIDTGRDRRYSGAGLGLAITKSLVEVMHGKISVTSEAGKGSCFTINLPLMIDSSSASSDSFYDEALKDKRVLVVSPNENIADSLVKTLAHWNLTITAAENAEEAVSSLRSNIAQDNRYHVVLIDAMLLINDIKHILKVISNLSDANSIHLVLLDRSDSHSRTDIGIHQAFAVILPRPARYETLVNSLYELLGDSKALIEDGKTSNIQLKPMRVLLADDNAINREFFVTWLQQLGVRVDEVADGGEAVACCRQIAYDLVLMDLHMPVLDGFEAATRIRESGHDTLKTPIIAVTADATDKTKAKIRRSALDGYLIKPFTEDQLLQMIETWCPKYLPSNQSTKPISDEFNLSCEDQFVDAELGLKLASGNKELWYSSLQTLVARLPIEQAELSHAIDNGDLLLVQQIAHRIIGGAAYCGASPLEGITAQLERAADNQEMQSVQEIFAQMCDHIGNLHHWFSRFPGNGLE